MRQIVTKQILRGPTVSRLILAATVFSASMLLQSNVQIEPSWAANFQSQPSDLVADTTQQLTVQKGDTLLKILEYAGAPQRNAAAATRAVKKVFDPKKLRVGQRIFVKLKPASNGDMLLSVFSVELGKNSFVQVIRSGNGKYRPHRANRPWPQDNTVISENNYRPTDGIVFVHARHGHTIGNIMHSLDIWERDIGRSVKALKTHFDPRRLKVGGTIHVG